MGGFEVHPFPAPPCNSWLVLVSAGEHELLPDLVFQCENIPLEGTRGSDLLGTLRVHLLISMLLMRFPGPFPRAHFISNCRLGEAWSSPSCPGLPFPHHLNLESRCSHQTLLSHVFHSVFTKSGQALPENVPTPAATVSSGTVRLPDSSLSPLGSIISLCCQSALRSTNLIMHISLLASPL